MNIRPLRDTGIALAAVLAFASCGDRPEPMEHPSGTPRPEHEPAMIVPPGQTDPGATPGDPAPSPRSVPPATTGGPEPSGTMDPAKPGGNASDERISQEIHKALEERSDLSAQARAIAITAQEGVVVLRGAVHGVHERDILVALASEQDGVKLVDDQLETVP